MFTIRKSELKDIPEMLKTFAIAVQTMRKNGNLEQWINYPPDGLLEKDIQAGKSYVIEANGKIAGTFYFALEEDPTYLVIDDGAWLNDKPYAVIHRIAVSRDSHGKGVAAFIFDSCFARFGNLKIDTHRDNLPMQRALEKRGFIRCGIIHLANGDERIAFQREN